MLTEICAEIRNYFEVPNGRHFGTFTISGGSIAPLDFFRRVNTSVSLALSLMTEFTNTLPLT